MKQFFRWAKQTTLALAVLSVAALGMERAGFLDLGNVLSVGKSMIDRSYGAQNTCVMPTTGTVSGLSLVTSINSCFASILSSNSGNSAPANGPGAAAVIGQVWLDTSSSPNAIRVYDGASWNIIGWSDQTNHVWTPPVGGGNDTVASATTTDLWSVRQASVTVSGTATITALASSSAVAGTLKVVRFTGAATLTYNATSLILPGLGNITTAAGDTAVVLALTATNVAVVSYSRIDGTPIALTANFTGAVAYNSAIVPTTLAGNTNNWNPAGLAAAIVVRASASSSLSLTGLTAPGTGGRLIVLQNVGASNTITLTSEDALSTAANRFALASSLTLQPNDVVSLVYDGTASRWRPQSPSSPPAPNVQVFTSGAGATYITPTGAKSLFIQMIAGGGGGARTGSGTATAGGTSSFNSITAIGGGGAINGDGGAGGTGGVGTADRLPGGAGSSSFVNSSTGSSGGNGIYGGGGRGIGATTACTVGGANTGGGGGGGIDGGGGASGESASFSISSPAASYTYTVGSTGAAIGSGACAGAAGRITVTAYF